MKKIALIFIILLAILATSYGQKRQRFDDGVYAASPSRLYKNAECIRIVTPFANMEAALDSLLAYLAERGTGIDNISRESGLVKTVAMSTRSDASVVVTLFVYEMRDTVMINVTGVFRTDISGFGNAVDVPVRCAGQKGSILMNCWEVMNSLAEGIPCFRREYVRQGKILFSENVEK